MLRRAPHAREGAGSEGRAYVVGDHLREQRRLVVPALSEAARVQGHRDDDPAVEPRVAGGAPKQVTEGPREIGAPLVFEPAERASERAPEGAERDHDVDLRRQDSARARWAKDRSSREPSVARGAGGRAQGVDEEREGSAEEEEREGSKEEPHTFYSRSAKLLSCVVVPKCGTLARSRAAQPARASVERVVALKRSVG